MKTAKILNVDDHAVNRYIRTQVLQGAGYQVIEAGTGAETLELIARESPQVVLLDINLPDINGAEICRRIKNDLDSRSAIVIHISATLTSVRDRIVGLEGGADGYLVEPVEPELLLATVRSMLRLWEAETRLEESLAVTRDLAAKYQSLVEAVPQVIFTATAAGHWDYLSEQFSANTQVRTEDALGERWFDLLHLEDREQTWQKWRQSMRTGEPFEAEYRFQNNDGSYRWNLARARAVRNSEGEIVQWVGSATDIHERKLLNEEIKLRHQEFVGLAEHSPDIIARLDLELRHTYVNPAIRRVSSLKPEEHLGKTNRELGWPPPECSQWEEECLKVVRTGEPREFEFSYDPNGKTCHFQARLVPEFDKDGELESLLSIISEVTDRKHAELALLRSNVALKRSNEDLAQFAHAASHDLKEPLRTVTMYTQLLAKQYGKQFDATAAKYMDVIQAAATRMMTLIEDLLAFSQSGSSEMFTGRLFSASDMVRGAVENLKNAIEESGAVVSVGELPAIAVDVPQFTLLLQNLIGNAIKYRKPEEPPRIEISAKQNGKCWLFSVRDNGMGFSQAHAEQIFGAFKRLHGREIPGTGIGLAIVKRVIERHDGEVWAESQPGRGATFFLRVPIPDHVSKSHTA